MRWTLTCIELPFYIVSKKMLWCNGSTSVVETEGLGSSPIGVQSNGC